MKIKFLKIRNIASIECGDIDFENGLIDSDSGKPASLFLITGDTGSGKSVILDCISMALYGTTPRVKSVSDSRNNVYKNNDGEEISVNNIRQYTRIGISWKDECYSELSFTGNDGIDYVSIFSLGRTRQRNYRDPAWKLIIDNSKIIEKRDEIKETIRNAVGLTFEQFSRMAMLAQGQFATFLTGKKEERERILEQLTSTDIFSRYGEAIASIFKTARQDKELSAKIYEEFGKKILNDETRESLESELDAQQKAASIFRNDMERHRQRISLTEATLKAEKDIADLETENSRIKKIEDSPDFRKREAIISLWDKTERERNLLADKLETAGRIASDYRTLQGKKADFINLSADLNIRLTNAESRTKLLEKEYEWIKSQEHFNKIFSDSAVTIHKINTYLALIKESGIKEKEVGDDKTRVSILTEEIRTNEKAADDLNALRSNCRQEIIRKSEERDALNPGRLRKENEILISRLQILKELAARLTKAESEKEEIAGILSDLDDSSSYLSELHKTAAINLAEYQKAEKKLKDAEERYVTMHLSLENNFRELRKKLSEEHAANCPLCGQSIAHHSGAWNNEEYFSSLLSPLEKEKNKLAEECSSAKTAYEEAEKIKNTTSGGLKAKEAELKKKKKSLEKTEDEIKGFVKDLDMNEDSDLADHTMKELGMIEAELRIISKDLTITDKIQKEIDMLIRRKEDLDKQYQNSDALLQKMMRSLAKVTEAVKNTERRLEELRRETQTLCHDIDEAMTGYAAGWQSDPSAAAARLKIDAEEYLRRSSRYTEDKKEHEVLMKALESMSDTMKRLAEKLKSTEAQCQDALASSSLPLDTGLLERKWNDLMIEVSTICGRIADNENKNRETEKILNEYYINTGTTESTLRHLLGATDEVNEARSLLQKHRDETSRNKALLSEAIKSKKGSLKALDIEDMSRLEDLQTMKANLADKEKHYGELEQKTGVIKERLEADEKSRQQSERQRADLEKKTIRYEKWEKMNRYFGGTRFRTLVQSHILRPLLDNANIYLRRITDHYTLTCSDDNEQLSILVLDRYHNNEPRSVTVLSGGERFMISLALSLALSAMNRPDLNVDILFIDEGFGTLDAKSLDMVIGTLRRLPEINGQTGRRVGVISHREELTEQIPVQIRLWRSGEGRSRLEISNQL